MQEEDVVSDLAYALSFASFDDVNMCPLENALRRREQRQLWLNKNKPHRKGKVWVVDNDGSHPSTIEEVKDALTPLAKARERVLNLETFDERYKELFIKDLG